LAGKLLRFLVSHWGIEANPDKIQAIEAMRPPARLKDVQKLTGSLAALSCFISRLAERALPFFKLMRGSSPFTWTEEAEQAFQEMKQYLTFLPVLVAPERGEALFLYLAATTEVIIWCWPQRGLSNSCRGPPRSPYRKWRSDHHQCNDQPCFGGSDRVPTREKDRRPRAGESPAQGEEPSPAAKVKTIQNPVYYVSEVLYEAKARYSETHKLLYAILITSRKLHHYFQAQKIVVVTSYPLRAILHNSNTMGNIAKWAAEFAGFQLDFQPHHTIKSQVLADFVVEWTPTPCVPGVWTMIRTPRFQKPGL
jgi:hypothetical protein